MSRGRRQVIQLDEPARVYYSNEPANENEEDDEDSAGDMPTPERLVTDDMISSHPPPPAPVASSGMEIDSKVANFLAEIDALDGADPESSRSPAPQRNQDASPPRDKYSPAREKSPSKTKLNVYSSMFVKGTPEFVKKPEEKHATHSKKMEPWPEEPKSDWQQLTDEKTNYPYYWNTVTNEVVWEMPPEFSQYLLRHKEYEEKVERGLREGTLDPAQRGKPAPKQEETEERRSDYRNSAKPSKSSSRQTRRSSHSEDSSSDSSDSDNSRSRDSPRYKRSQRLEKHEVTSSSAENSQSASHDDKCKRSATPDLPDSTRSEDKRVSTSKQPSKEVDSMDFDIDDIDKELEMALERKRQELMKMEGKKGEDSEDDKKKDEHRHRDDERRDERHKKHGRHRDLERDRDTERYHEHEEKKPKLTLKERLRIEMELKMEKERRRKRAIEEMMARELEQTVGSSSRHKRHRDDHEKSLKRYRHDEDREDYRSHRDDYRDYGRGYDEWQGASMYDDRFVPPPTLKPPPPTDEMIAYEEERRSQVVDYGHGRSGRDMNGDSDPEESRSADSKELEVRKLEALQLAELALSKLEFLEVTKKGLSKLQILLIELETRHQDWQAGGLTTNHFLGKLREANWQLEQYEASAAPAGWVCSWDRDYRRYFYTHKLTGKTQWDYPDADEIRAEDAKGQDKTKTRQSWDPEREISSTSDRGKTSMEKEILASMSLPPPPPPPAEEHPSVKSLMLMYGSSSESETEEPSSKKAKQEVQTPTDLDSVPLPPLPPEESHREKEKKDKHKKKKKKEKSKKKEREKAESGVIGPAFPPASVEAPPVSIRAPPTSIQAPPISIGMPPPPPPPDVPLEAGVTAEPQIVAASTEIHPHHEIPVYGSVEDDQQGQNDQPLEFSSVPQEMTGPHPYETDGMVESSVIISQGPQVASSSTFSHEPEPYTTLTSGYPDPWSGEGGGDGYNGETTVDSAGLHAPGTEEKKKKKKDKMGTGSISLKKKHVSSMVQKWQKVKKEVELEEQHRQIREAEIRRKLAELE